MSLTAGTVINHARDMNPALSRANAPDVVGYRALTRMSGDLVQAVTVRQPAFLAKSVTLALPLAVFADGLSLATLIPAGWLDLLEVFAQRADTSDATQWPRRVQMVPWEQRDMPQPWPGVTLRDNTLFLLGDVDAWTAFASLKLTYTPSPASVTGDNSVLEVPDDALDALATMLCAFYLWRLVGDPAYRVTGDMANLWDSKASGERDRFLNRIWRTGQRQSYRVRDVT